MTIASGDEAGLAAALKELGPSVASATVDLTDNATIFSLFEQRGSFDHMVVDGSEHQDWSSALTGP